ncbi:MAG: peptidylprolyl isomerase [Pseudomonadota bacterium]
MFKRLLGAAAIAASFALPAVAQEGDNPVLATVNGEEITAADVAFAVDTLGNALERVPAGQRPQMVLDLMIDMQLLAEAAEKAGFSDDPVVERRVEYYRTQTLRDLYMEQLIEEQVTDEAIRARYDREAAELGPSKEVSARHILVDEEDKAKELIAEIEGGGDFAEIAEANSKDPGSASRGGSLGFFRQGQMVPPFEEAAFALEPGEMTSEPVQSQFGYHIIKVDEVRDVPVPAFEQVAESVRELMIREAFVNEVARLKETAEIEKTTPAQ